MAISFQPSATRSTWRIAPLMMSLVAACILLASWLRPETRGIWDRADLLVFRSLNNTLSLGEWWQTAWAVANCRGFDAVSGVLLAGVVLLALRMQDRWNVLQSAISIAVFFLFIFAARTVVCEFFLESMISFERHSPTQTLDNCYRLSTLVPQVNAKDESGWCFPGDHGIVLFSVALYISYISNSEVARWGWLLAVLLGLPRVLAGAHWFTDLAVGSLSVALVATALLMATPLHDQLVTRCSRIGRVRRVTREPSQPATAL